MGKKIPRIQRALPEGWTEVMASKIESNCQVIFKRQYVNALNDISVQAECGVHDCPVKFHLFIPHPKPFSNVMMKVDVHGCPSHADKIERPLKGHNRQILGESLKNRSTTETFYRSFNNSGNPTYSIDVMKKAKSEVNLLTRLHCDPLLDLLGEKLHGSTYIFEISDCHLSL